VKSICGAPEEPAEKLSVRHETEMSPISLAKGRCSWLTTTAEAVTHPTVPGAEYPLPSRPLSPCMWPCRLDRKDPSPSSNPRTSALSLKLLVQRGSDQNQAHKYAPSAAGGPSPAPKCLQRQGLPSWLLVVTREPALRMKLAS